MDVILYCNQFFKRFVILHLNHSFTRYIFIQLTLLFFHIDPNWVGWVNSCTTLNTSQAYLSFCLILSSFIFGHKFILVLHKNVWQISFGKKLFLIINENKLKYLFFNRRDGIIWQFSCHIMIHEKKNGIIVKMKEITI